LAELKIELIAVGDELLMGLTLDTNSNFIARSLAKNGFRLAQMRWVADIGQNIHQALSEAWERSDIVLVTGGLGPTHDDLTRPVIAGFFGDRLEPRDDIRNALLRRFEKRGFTPAPGWEVMVDFPTRAIPIPNGHGAAPGIHFSQDNRELFAMPGVPGEMIGMMEDYILPILKKKSTGQYRYRVIKTVGASESQLAMLIGDPGKLLPVSLAFLPSNDNGVTLRLSLYSNTDSGESNSLITAEHLVSKAVEPYIYCKDESTIESVIIERMRKEGLQLALAESCTGGMIAARIVDVPGSSDILNRGFVTYSNEAKCELLGVSVSSIEQFGAVSAEVASAMATGARERSNVDIAISVTGIAGPGGATDTKPVGLTYIAIAGLKGVEVQRHLFAGSREENRKRATFTALSILFDYLKRR